MILVVYTELYIESLPCVRCVCMIYILSHWGSPVWYIYVCVCVCVCVGGCGYGGLVAKLCSTLVTPWTVAFQAPLSVGFSRQEYWSGLPFSSPGDLPNPGIKSNPVSCIAGRFFTN